MQEGTPDDILLRIHEGERVAVEADPRGLMSKRLKAVLVLNRQPLDSLSHRLST